MVAVQAFPDDPSFPRLHGRPAAGWINDPNGCARIDGVYHVFFQHNPAAPRHAEIAWGHASSADLVHWEQHPVALRPRPGELDAAGCWTGCVVDDDGVPTAVYSAVADHSGRSAVLLARSDRSLQSWVQDRVAAAGMPGDVPVTDVRDPFVVSAGGHRYAVQGAGRRGGPARVLVYGCDDLAQWTELGTLLTSEHPIAGAVAQADIWECPNLVELGGRWVLIVSLWRELAGTVSLSGVRYLVGDLAHTGDGLVFEPAAGGLLDAGPAFYAPQVLCDSGRVLMWGWSWELGAAELGSRGGGRSPEQVDDAGWAGVLTFCRELTLIGDVLVSSPAAELAGLRDRPLPVRPGEPFRAPSFDIELDGAGQASLSLLTGGEQVLVHAWQVVAQPLAQPRLLADGSIIEIFDGSGTAFTTRAYPESGSSWVLALEDGIAARGWTTRLP